MTSLRPGRLLLALLLGNTALLLVYALDILLQQPSWTVHALFDLDGEANIPAWYTSAQLLIAACCFGLTPGSTDAPIQLPRLFFLLVSAGFAFLSLDEAAGIHESITRSFRDIESLPRFSGDHGIWIPLYLGAGGLFAAATARYWLRLWRIERPGMMLFGAGVLLFLCGGVVIEAASYEELRGLVNRDTYLWTVALEEFLEMCGASFMVAAALQVNQTLTTRASL